MPNYLIEASYSTEGVGGVADKGGTARREAVEKLIGAAGGKLECFYFAFGDADVYAIAELPSDEAAAGVALSINRSGSTKIRTIVLLTPAQIDAAASSAPTYTRPGA